MSLFLVRHGETRLSGTFCGSSNPRLTPRGAAQARAAALILARFKIADGYVSPLLRARQTAAILRRRLKISFKTHEDLREIHFGAWEGVLFSDIKTKWPALAKQWAVDPMKVRIPGAESFDLLRKRAWRFLSFVKRRSLQEHIVVVAHGGTLSAIVIECLKLSSRKFPDYVQPAGSVRVIQGGRVKTLC